MRPDLFPVYDKMYERSELFEELTGAGLAPLSAGSLQIQAVSVSVSSLGRSPCELAQPLGDQCLGAIAAVRRRGVDHRMPTRIAFWTSSFESEMEAIASEVATLRRHFPSSVVWGINHRRWAIVAPGRGQYSLHPKLHLLFRGATRLLEPIFHLNHIFGSMSDWFHLQGVRRRPTILTVALDSDSIHPHLLERVDRFVVEFEAARGQLLGNGISPTRIQTIFPPVNLTRFVPTAPPDGPFTVLFASSPELPNWLEARGLSQLLDAAGLRPEIRFRLLWRPWGQSREAIVAWVRERGLRNVEITEGQFDDMPSQYQARARYGRSLYRAPSVQADAELAYREPGLWPPHPLHARGRLAGMVQEARAGVIVSASGVEIAEGLDRRLPAGWTSYSISARKLAERCFAVERFLKDYQRTYYEVLPCHLKKSIHFSWRAIGGHKRYSGVTVGEPSQRRKGAIAGHYAFRGARIRKVYVPNGIKRRCKSFPVHGLRFSRCPSNADIVVIRSLLHAARIWGIIAIAIS